jgi:4-hydroxybenzoate polyprenyltransferase
MAFNRIIDARVDLANPRTRDRAIPQGTLSMGTAWLFTLASVALFVLASAMLNDLALALSPLALAIVFGYSFRPPRSSCLSPSCAGLRASTSSTRCRI